MTPPVKKWQFLIRLAQRFSAWRLARWNRRNSELKTNIRSIRRQTKKLRKGIV